MTDTLRIPNHVVIEGNLSVNGNAPEILRSRIVQESSKVYDLAAERWRKPTSFHEVLAATSGSGSLALVGGTAGTGTPCVQTSDAKAAGSQTLSARATFVLPPEYVTGKTVALEFRAGMVTTIADVACTIDCQAYKSDDAGAAGADLVTTSAQSINSLTFAAKTFQVNPASLAAGDQLDIVVAIAINDDATATEVIARIGRAKILLDIQG